MSMYSANRTRRRYDPRSWRRCSRVGRETWPRLPRTKSSASACSRSSTSPWRWASMACSCSARRRARSPAESTGTPVHDISAAAMQAKTEVTIAFTQSSSLARVAAFRVCHGLGHQRLQGLRVDVGEAPDVDTDLADLVLPELGQQGVTAFDLLGDVNHQFTSAHGKRSQRGIAFMTTGVLVM